MCLSYIYWYYEKTYCNTYLFPCIVPYANKQIGTLPHSLFNLSVCEHYFFNLKARICPPDIFVSYFVSHDIVDTPETELSLFAYR